MVFSTSLPLFAVHHEHHITPVMVAIENGHRNTTRMLAKCGADINRKYDDGMTPLMFALNTVSSFWPLLVLFFRLVVPSPTCFCRLHRLSLTTKCRIY